MLKPDHAICSCLGCSPRSPESPLETSPPAVPASRWRVSGNTLLNALETGQLGTAKALPCCCHVRMVQASFATHSASFTALTYTLATVLEVEPKIEGPRLRLAASEAVPRRRHAQTKPRPVALLCSVCSFFRVDLALCCHRKPRYTNRTSAETPGSQRDFSRFHRVTQLTKT